MSKSGMMRSSMCWSVVNCVLRAAFIFTCRRVVTLPTLLHRGNQGQPRCLRTTALADRMAGTGSASSSEAAISSSPRRGDSGHASSNSSAISFGKYMCGRTAGSCARWTSAASLDFQCRSARGTSRHEVTTEETDHLIKLRLRLEMLGE